MRPPKNEAELFKFLRDNHYKDLINKSSNSSRYDCFSISSMYHIEMKCRRKHYKDLMIEKRKYDWLIENSKDGDWRAVYINSTPLGVWGFFLDETELTWETRNLPNRSRFGVREIVPKEVSYLHIEDGFDLWECL